MFNINIFPSMGLYPIPLDIAYSFDSQTISKTKARFIKIISFYSKKVILASGHYLKKNYI